MVRLYRLHVTAILYRMVQWGWGLVRRTPLSQVLALLWLLHIQMLLGLDSVAVASNPMVESLPARYYIIQSVPPLIILGFGQIRSFVIRFESHLLPIILGAMTILPLALTPLIIDQPRSGPLTASTTLMGFRMMPLELLAFIVIALHYGWAQMVSLCVGTSASLIMLNWLTWTQMTPGSIALSQIGFLINGRCITVIVTRLRNRTEELTQANQQLRHYASTLEQLTISRERNRMARELHDTLAHTLADLTVQMETAKAYVRINPETTSEILTTALVSARSGLHDTRRSLKSLRASPLVELGLTAALGDLAQTVAASADLRLTLSIDSVLPPLPPDTEQAIYRIAQEALANVNYHANAIHLTVTLTVEHALLHLLIQDDGRGFDLNTPVAAGHYGLDGMAEWAQITGGRLIITSMPNQGTLVHAEIGAY